MTSNLKEKHSLYIVFIVTVLVAIVATVGGVAAHMDMGQTLVLTITAETLTLMAELFFLMRSQVEEPEVDFIKGEKAILRRGSGMKDDAKREILAIWCVMQYGPSLKKYFDDFRGSFVLRRLINVKKFGSKNVSDHLSHFLKELKSGSYVVTSTTHSSFEFLVMDKTEALFLCPHHVTGELHAGIFSKNEHFVGTIIGTFEKLDSEGTRLEIPEGTDDKTAKSLIDDWIKKCT
jgi:hypothetical protein